MKAIKQLIYIFFVIFLFSSLLKSVLNYRDRIQFYRQTKEKYEKLKKRNIELKTEVVRKRSADEIEKTVRNQLNLLKEDEVALLIPQPSPTKVVTPTPRLENWQKWWQVFFK